MCSYNNGSSIQDSIESILNQSYTNFEFLILDDGSTDETAIILDKYKSNNKVKLFKNASNLGLTKSLNILINHSSGEYIARQDADDISLRTRLEEQLNFITKKNIEVCTTRALRSTDKTLIPGLSHYIPKKILFNYKNPFIHGTLMIKSEILKEYMYDEEYFYSQDFELFLRLSKKYKIKTVNKGLYILNVKNNISVNFKNEQLFYFNKAKNKFKNKL